MTNTKKNDYNFSQTFFSRHLILFVFILLFLLFFIMVASIFIGTKSFSVQEIINNIFQNKSGTILDDILKKRFYRTIFGVLCGSSLGVSGSLMQTITKNPLADPSILGVNEGAAFFVVFAIAFFNINSLFQYILFALLGSFIAVVIVFGISFTGFNKGTPLKMVLAGMVISILFSSLVTIIMLINNLALDQFRFWQLGSLGSSSPTSLLIFLILFTLAMIIVFICTPSLNILILGEEMAKSLGADTNLTRFLATIAGVLLCALTTALAGPIGFIGLLAPHFIRLLVGSELKILIPLSALSGSCFLIISDILGRILGSPSEINVGVITAIIGAPVLIYLANKMKVNSL